ncbi:MAG: hypothetical protein HQM12_01865 [SAR324 cluster bacterium]|nr:hypothetical protein [SAR324 cluster bacterium]
MKKLAKTLIASFLGASLAMTGCGLLPEEDDSKTSTSSSSEANSNSVTGKDEIRGADDGSVSALTVSSKVSVVDAKADAGTARVTPLRLGTFRLSAADVPADSAYNTDKTHVFVEEKSTQALDTVNNILCMLDLLSYDEMLNKGPYIAQVDENLCADSKDDASSANQSSQSDTGSSSPEYTYFTVESIRKDDNSNQYVTFWFSQDNDMGGGGEEGGPKERQAAKPAEGETKPADGAKPSDGGEKPPEGDMQGPPEMNQIQAKIKITEGASDTNPYGLFVMNFKMIPADEEGNAYPNAPLMGTGLLKSQKQGDKVVLSFFNKMGAEEMGFSGLEQAAITRSKDGTAGSGSLKTSFTASFNGETFSETMDFGIAFNESLFLRKDNKENKQVCLNRDTFEESVWRYGLYDSVGKQVSLNSGFPIIVTDADGKKQHGWVGYHGIHVGGPDSQTLKNGDTVTKVSFDETGESAGEDYTVFISGGRLRKMTRQELTLKDVTGIPLNYSEFSTTGPGDQFIVKWNGAKLQKVAKMDQTNWIPEPLTTPVDVSTATLDFDELQMFSQALGGSIAVTFKTGTGTTKTSQCTENSSTSTSTTSFSRPSYNCVPTDATVVIFYSEDVVSPKELTGDLSLVCFDNCPDPDKITTSSPYFAGTSMGPGSDPSVNLSFQDNKAPADATKISYTFSKADMVLKSGTKEIVRSSSSTSTSASSDGFDQFQFGVQSGILFEPTTANLDKLACTMTRPGPRNTSVTTTNTCAWQARNELAVYYVYETGPNSWNRYSSLKDAAGTFLTFDPPMQVKYTHTGNGYTNATFYLEYQGFGNLHGIPGKCVDFETGESTDCKPDAQIRWVPEFSLADGVVVTDTKSTEYLIKGLDKEQRMQKVEDAQCASLTIEALTLPDPTEWEDPKIGDEPDLTDAPAVIDGVLQL